MDISNILEPEFKTTMEEAEEQYVIWKIKIMENNAAEEKREGKVLYHECRLKELRDS